jgi:acetyltransferase-like isoleucine patch superfamily enzyme
MIHHTSLVSPKAKLGNNVSIGAFTIIHDNVEIGADTVIDAYCEIGYPTMLADGAPLIIGSCSKIRSHSVFYEGSCFGEKLVTGHRVTVREKTTAGKYFQIGTLADIQGDCVIGDYVRFQSNVFVGQKSKLGDFIWIFPHVVLTNDPHPPSNILLGCEIGDFASIATMSIILPGIKVGERSLIAANSLVNKDVEPFTVVGGSPAKFLCNAAEIKLRDGSGRSAYPWTNHFTRGYPSDVTQGWNDQQARCDNI